MYRDTQALSGKYSRAVTAIIDDKEMIDGKGDRRKKGDRERKREREKRRHMQDHDHGIARGTPG